MYKTRKHISYTFEKVLKIKKKKSFCYQIGLDTENTYKYIQQSGLNLYGKWLRNK